MCLNLFQDARLLLNSQAGPVFTAERAAAKNA
jgi:hypothetical protein